MRAIGCVRQIDKLGRLVLPSDIRKSLNIVNGVDSVEFFVDNDSVIIKKYRPACVFCKSDENIQSFKNQTVCQSCLNELKAEWIIMIVALSKRNFPAYFVPPWTTGS